MQDLLANVDHIKFDLEIAVEQQLGAQPLPFPGMDSKCSDASCCLADVAGKLWSELQVDIFTPVCWYVCVIQTPLVSPQSPALLCVSSS